MADLYEIDLSPQSPRLYAKLLPELIELYLAEVGRTVQEKTIYGYRAKLQHVLDWWAAAGPLCGWVLSADELAALGMHLETVVSERGEPLSYNSRNDVLRRLRQVLRWAYERKRAPIDLSSDVPPAHGMAPARRPVGLEVLAQLLAAARRGHTAGRDAALVALLAGTGIRCEECASLRVGDVTLYADLSGYAVLRTTKFDDPRIVGIDAATGVHVQPWLDVLGDPSLPLFPSRNGHGQRPLSPSGVYGLIVRLAVEAGVREQIQGPHDLRRMFATLWMRRLPGAGYGELLQRQMGHKSFATTQRYSLQDVDQVVQVMRQQGCSPMAQLAESRSPDRHLLSD
jgi:integrase